MGARLAKEEKTDAGADHVPPFPEKTDAGADHVPPFPQPISDKQYGVYELHKPAAYVEDPDLLDVVFLHGLQTNLKDAEHAWWSTWKSATSNGPVFWPAVWLKESIPNARILSVCYKADALKNVEDRKYHFSTVADSVLGYLTLAGVGKGGRPVFLVGHSMGGLIIKQLLLKAHFQASTKPESPEAQLLKGVRGVVFYATPHKGSFLQEWTESFLINNPIIGAVAGGRLNEDLLKRLKVFDEDTNELNNEFYDVMTDRGWKALCFQELKCMKLPMNTYKIVVEQAAASMEAARNIAINADHIGICKPGTKTEMSFLALADFIRNNLPVGQQQGVVERPLAVDQQQHELL